MLTSKKSTLLVLCIVGSASIFGLACGDSSNSNAPNSNADFVLTQEKLDSFARVAVSIETDIVGDKFAVFHDRKDTSIVKNDTMTFLHSLRDVTAATIDRNAMSVPGTIFARLFYTITDTLHSSPRKLKAIMLMVKHSRGFFPDGGDWEYISLPPDTTNIHPYGVLLDSSATATSINFKRGRLVTCGTCHQETQGKGMKDFLF
jgi:hypothetical protein